MLFRSQLFEKYAKSEDLHQRKVESQRKPKDAPQSSRTWTRTPQPDSGRDGRNQQQVHNIANQHPAGDAPRRQEYPPRAAEMELTVGVGDVRSRRADSTVFFTAKTGYVGWLSILPPMIAIILALITKEVLFSLIAGVLSGASAATT